MTKKKWYLTRFISQIFGLIGGLEVIGAIILAIRVNEIASQTPPSPARDLAATMGYFVAAAVGFGGLLWILAGGIVDILIATEENTRATAETLNRAVSILSRTEQHAEATSDILTRVIDRKRGTP